MWGGQGWRDSILAPPTTKQNNKRNKTALEEDGGGNGELKEHNAIPSPQVTLPPTTPPPKPAPGVASPEAEGEASPKKLGFDDAGDSNDEDEEDNEEDIVIVDAPALGQAEVDAITAARIKGKKQLLTDYLSLFDEKEEGVDFDIGGSSEDQVDARIQDLSLHLVGKVMDTKGSTTDHAEANRINGDFNLRVVGLHFLRPQRKRQMVDDGINDGDSLLDEDPEHTAKKPRVIATAHRKKKPIVIMAGASAITKHFSPLPGKKVAEESSAAMADDPPGDQECGVCGVPKETNCGICNLPLCTIHSQEHSHGDKPQPSNSPRPAAGKTVTFQDGNPDDDVTITTSPLPDGEAPNPSLASIFPTAKVHDNLDLVDDRNK